MGKRTLQCYTKLIVEMSMKYTTYSQRNAKRKSVCVLLIKQQETLAIAWKPVVDGLTKELLCFASVKGLFQLSSLYLCAQVIGQVKKREYI